MLAFLLNLLYVPGFKNSVNKFLVPYDFKRFVRTVSYSGSINTIVFLRTKPTNVFTHPSGVV